MNLRRNGKSHALFHIFLGGEEGERVQLFYLVSCDSCDVWVISSEKAEWVTCLCFWWIWIGCCFSYHLLLNLFASTPEMPQYWFSLHDLLFVSFIWVDGLTRQTTGTSPPTPKTHRPPTNNRNNKQQTITNQHYPPYNPKHHIGSWKFQWFFLGGKWFTSLPFWECPEKSKFLQTRFFRQICKTERRNSVLLSFPQNLRHKRPHKPREGRCWTVTILGKVEGLEREILQPFGGIYRNPTTISTLTQPPCFVGILSFFLGGGGEETNQSQDWFVFCGEKNWYF